LQDVVKLLNKSGVWYKALAKTLSDKDCYEEGCGSFLNGAAQWKEFVYDKKSDTRSVSLPQEDFNKVSLNLIDSALYIKIHVITWFMCLYVSFP
jgi:hypothetical protein